MARQELGPGICPVPDKTHTILVDRWGNRIMDRAAQPGDVYAMPPIPYHYKGYWHPPRIDPYSDGQKAIQAQDLKNLDQAILDLSQTQIGRRYLTFAYEDGFALKHNDYLVRLEGAAAINDAPSNSLWLGSNICISALQLTELHDTGHRKRNNRNLRYFGTQSLGSSIECVRAQEASSVTDEAEHAAECELITNPNHYQPAGIMEMFASYQPEVGKAALEALHLLAAGEKNAFRQAVHIAFYTPENLAFYDLQVIENFRCWIEPPKPDFRKDRDPYFGNPFHQHAKFFMADDHFTHDIIAYSLPYLKGAPYNLDDYTGLTNDPRVVKAYEKLVSEIEATPHLRRGKPLYKHFFMDRNDTPAEVPAMPADRLMQTIGMMPPAPPEPSSVVATHLMLRPVPPAVLHRASL